MELNAGKIVWIAEKCSLFFFYQFLGSGNYLHAYIEEYMKYKKQ